jgi:fructoselysine-6-P-deglycase FrlB-like protein
LIRAWTFSSYEESSSSVGSSGGGAAFRPRSSGGVSSSISISTSGNSQNVVRGLKKGKEIGTVNITLTGKDGGEIKGLSDVNINSNSNIILI